MYKLKHIPTGLFFGPSKDISIPNRNPNSMFQTKYVKTNLSKKGKTYPEKRYVDRAKLFFLSEPFLFNGSLIEATENDIEVVDIRAENHDKFH